MEYEIGPDESVSTAVIRAVSAVEGCDFKSLPPLFEVVDPESLDTLFASRNNGKTRRGGRLTFVYSHCEITIDNGEYITLELLDTRLRNTRELVSD